jgi:hypothetical protein
MTGATAQRHEAGRQAEFAASDNDAVQFIAVTGPAQQVSIESTIILPRML